MYYRHFVGLFLVTKMSCFSYWAVNIWWESDSPASLRVDSV